MGNFIIMPPLNPQKKKIHIFGKYVKAQHQHTE